MGYGNWLHGEAVGCGMVMATRLSHRLGWVSKSDLNRAVALIQRAKLPVTPPKDMNAETFMELMQVDKKVLDGSLRLVLLKGIGNSLVTADYDSKALMEILTNEGD